MTTGNFVGKSNGVKCSTADIAQMTHMFHHSTRHFC